MIGDPLEADIMPQPLARVKKDARVIFGISEDAPTANLWKFVTCTVSMWAHIDSLYAHMLCGFLKADFATVAAMYSSISSGEARKAALLAAADSVNPDSQKLISACMAAMRASRNRRNDFAHHIWAYSPELPDSLILIDPAALVESDAELRQFMADGKFIPGITNVGKANRLEFPQIPSPDRRRMMVYKEKELESEALLSVQCLGIVRELLKATSRTQPDDQARAKLLSEPRILREYERLSLQNDQAAPPPPPP